MSKIQVSKSKGASRSKVTSARQATAVKPPHDKARAESIAAADRVSKRADGAVGRPATQTESKQAVVLKMLSQPKGATVDAVGKATGWQKHSIRGFLSAVVRKKLGLSLKSEKIEGERRYRIEAHAVDKRSPSANASRRAKTARQPAA
jgi:hypothetical protein